MLAKKPFIKIQKASDILMLICTILAILFFTFIYFTINNLVYALTGGLFVLAYGLLYGDKVIKTYFKKQKTNIECSNFINTLIVSLSISNSLELAYKDATIKISKSLEKQVKQCSSIDVFDILASLQSYFKNNNYMVFLNILHMHLESGGNILEMSAYLQTELRRRQELVNSIKQINARKAYEFFTLWGFCIAIVLFCRFGLTNIYQMMQANELFNYELIFFYFFMLISFHVFISSVSQSIRKII